MTKNEVDQCRTDALRLVLLNVINTLGPAHGRLSAPSLINKMMYRVRSDLFEQCERMQGVDEVEMKFTWNCLDNILSIFECIMNFKEGPNVIDLLRIGLGNNMGIEK